MFKAVCSKECDVTRELASWLYGLKSVPEERTLKPARLSLLKTDFANGIVLVFRWATIDIKGDKYRVNGQHTSYLFHSGEPIPPGAKCTLEQYHGESLEDAVACWSTFDSRHSSRTSTEVTASYLGSQEDLCDLPKRAMMLAKNALVIERFGFGYVNKVSESQKLEAMKVNHDFAIWSSPYLSRPIFQRVGVAYAMLLTYRKNREVATRFWNEVHDGTNPDPLSGTRQLQVFLLSTSSDTGQGARSSKPKSTWKNTAATSVYCWNAWRENRQIKRLGIKDEFQDLI